MSDFVSRVNNVSVTKETIYRYIYVLATLLPKPHDPASKGPL